MPVANDATRREDSAALELIAQTEGRLQPPPDVRRATDHKPWQHALFRALRLYIAAMVAVVAWAFASGKVTG